MKVFMYKNIVVKVKKGDITEEDCEAIVNPANSMMIMGGGVAGAIKRKGGKIIEEEARRYAPVPVGEAIVTGAGVLKAKYVIHAPTMEKPAMPITVKHVIKAAQAVFKVACSRGFSCIAFPALGAGVGGVPVKESVKAILRVLKEMDLSRCSIREIRLIAWREKDYVEMVNACKEQLEVYS
ncbi:MAG: macro domain-containing protein [Thermoprotei archaeon]|nr:MAG: macro domain-containing protein [Thermoprotei archaeon]